MQIAAPPGWVPPTTTRCQFLYWLARSAPLKSTAIWPVSVSRGLGASRGSAGRRQAGPKQQQTKGLFHGIGRLKPAGSTKGKEGVANCQPLENKPVTELVGPWLLLYHPAVEAVVGGFDDDFVKARRRSVGSGPLPGGLVGVGRQARHGHNCALLPASCRHSRADAVEPRPPVQLPVGRINQPHVPASRGIQGM